METRGDNKFRISSCRKRNEQIENPKFRHGQRSSSRTKVNRNVSPDGKRKRNIEKTRIEAEYLEG